MSSLIISPGWTGGSPFFFAIIAPNGVLTQPAERDAIVPSDTHRPSLRLSLQAVNPEPGDVHILRLSCYVQQLQNAHALADVPGADPPCLAGAVDLFKAFMPE